MKDKIYIIPAKHFIHTLLFNVDNPNLNDADFRDLVRTTLPIVEHAPLQEPKDV